eukprot:2542424-Rhodomonas_salina.1
MGEVAAHDAVVGVAGVEHHPAPGAALLERQVHRGRADLREHPSRADHPVPRSERQPDFLECCFGPCRDDSP